ncbi:glycosyltransferase family 2 protein [Paraburkholderia kirstenboschensis]|uniref:Glycosyltransferase n=1 Tax=Paraburkholderia kirstenboschensis TaxID=1245436 RepID=A0ABZ0EU94_9BURK|nr:glycosyltransferase [Paraburkholderia kirstenboschensis]WOD20696.1 glycosyltransferase [Paraburkholderia kirstenboschensis]
MPRHQLQSTVGASSTEYMAAQGPARGPSFTDRTHADKAVTPVTDAPAASVTVVMANFNGERWIGEAIRSVQRQSLEDWELIVADDASTDASVEIVRAFARDDFRIRLLTARINAGPSTARNRALECARGRWITFLDSDDVLAEGRLESLMQLAETSDQGFVADDLLIMDENGLLTGHSLLGLEGFRSFDAVSLVRAPRLAYLKPMISAGLMTQLRYEERLRSGEDFDMLLRLLVKYDARISVYPPMGYRYRRRSGSLSTDRSADRQALRGMLDANTCFRASHTLSGSLATACARRDRSLKASLQWVDVTEAIREKRFVAALRHVVGHPAVLTCVMQFFQKRFSRLIFRHKRRARTYGL